MQVTPKPNELGTFALQSNIALHQSEVSLSLIHKGIPILRISKLLNNPILQDASRWGQHSRDPHWSLKKAQRENQRWQLIQCPDFDPSSWRDYNLWTASFSPCLVVFYSNWSFSWPPNVHEIIGHLDWYSIVDVLWKFLRHSVPCAFNHAHDNLQIYTQPLNRIPQHKPTKAGGIPILAKTIW